MSKINHIRLIAGIFYFIGLYSGRDNLLCPLLQKVRGKMKPATSLIVVGGGDDLVSVRLRWSCNGWGAILLW